MSFFSNAKGQIASWELDTDGAPNNVDANITVGNFSSGTGVGTLNFGADGAYANSWTETSSPEADNYFQIIISPKTGYNLRITELNFSERRSLTGIRDYQIQWSKAADFSSSTTIATVNVPDEDSERDGSISGLDINVLDGETIYIRWFGYNAEGSAGTWRINDGTLNVDGFVSSTSAVHYRTKADGSWDNIATWETSPDLSSWSNATEVPTASNSLSISVGHSVTISDFTGDSNSDVEFDNMTIAAGGTMTMSIDAKVEIKDAAGTDFTVNGTLIDNASGSVGLQFETGSTWVLGANGTIIKTDDSSVANYRDFYSGGISNIPASANWIFRYNGESLSVATVGMYFPNLTIESINGSHQMNAFDEHFKGSTDYCTVKGNLDIGGTTSNSTNNISVYNQNTNSTPMIILGNLIVRQYSTLSNENGYAIGDIGTGFRVEGDVTIETNASFDINTSTTGVLDFAGSSEQTISGDGTFDIYDMNVAKSSNKVILNRNVETVVNNDLDISGGTLEIAAGKELTINNELKNTVGASGLVIKSDASGTASIIQEIGNVPATVERYLTGANWHLVMPTTSGNSDYGADWFYSYYEITDDYWNTTTIFGTSGWTQVATASQTEGFIYKKSTDQTCSFSGGNLTAIDHDFNITYTTNGHSGTVAVDDLGNIDWTYFLGWNLIGNPYASAIEWASMPNDDDIENGVYFWDGVKYQYYLKSGTAYSIGVNYSVTGANSVIPAGQAFFVKAKTGGNGQITIPENIRIHDNQTFWKNENNEIVPNLLRMNIEQNEYTDETVVWNCEESTDSHDADNDLLKRFSMDNSKPQIYTTNPSKTFLFALNSFPEIGENKQIPIGVKIGTTGEHIINCTENNFDNINIYLEDTELDKIIDLNNTTSYTFYAEEGVFNSRFVLHFSLSEMSSISDEDIVSNVNIYPNPSIGAINVHILNIDEVSIIKIISATGKILLQKETDNNLTSIDITNYQDGIYYIEITNSQMNEVRKVVLRK